MLLDTGVEVLQKQSLLLLCCFCRTFLLQYDKAEGTFLCNKDLVFDETLIFSCYVICETTKNVFFIRKNGSTEKL